jgi:hypothetical protein
MAEGQGTTNTIHYWMKLIAILFILKAHGRKINPFPCYKGTDLILLRSTYIHIYIYIYIYIHIYTPQLAYWHTYIQGLACRGSQKTPTVYVTYRTPALIETLNHYVITLQTLN